MTDYSLTCSFRIEIDGLDIGSFREASPLEWSSEVLSFVEGGYNDAKRCLPGQGSLSKLTLKKGWCTKDNALSDTIKTLYSSYRRTRFSMSLVVLDDSKKEEVARFNLYNAFVSRWKGPVFNAMQSEIAVEEIDICFESLEEVR